MNQIDSFNISSLRYNESILDQINQICEPLFKNFGITHFWYTRIFDDGYYLEITNDIKWKEYFLSHDLVNKQSFLFEAIQNIDNKTTILPWPYNCYKQDPLLSALLKFNICHGLNILEKRQGFIENFGFATTNDNSNIINFYMNNISILKHFILFFEEKMNTIINFFDSKNLATFKWNLLIQDKITSEQHQKITQFLQETRLQKYILKLEREKICLSKREVECLNLLSSGNTTKEIGRLINLSPRTVECYINNIKKKTGFQRKTELIRMFNDSAIKMCAS